MSVNWEYGFSVFVAVVIVVVFLIIQIESGSKDLVIQELDGYFKIFHVTRCAVLIKFSELLNIDIYRY